MADHFTVCVIPFGRFEIFLDRAIVHSTVEYCATVWDSYYQNQATTLEKVQRRAACWVTGRFHTSSVSSMLSDLGWRDLSQIGHNRHLRIVLDHYQGPYRPLPVLEKHR